MRARSTLCALFLASSLATLHCGGSTATGGFAAGDGGPDSSSPGVDGGTDDPGPPPLTSTSKVDVLFVVDDSSSMADKSGLLAGSVESLLRRLATPNCVQGGQIVGVSSGGACSAGTLEFAPVDDIHVGVITSSLGAMGGDTCPESGGFDKHAHLQTSGVANASKGFLAYGAGGSTDVNALVADAQALIRGVGEKGCGFEAQLEAAYHFLVQPDPWAKITLDANNQATLGTDVDTELLQQRAAFLRPDSLVAVVMITDEDDSAVDPRSLGGQGWAFEAMQFPGSPTFRADGKTTTAPRGTSVCKTNPGAPGCTSCGFAATCDATTADCQAIRNDPECQKNGGYFGPTEDQLNVRFHRMKERFGIDPQFPVARYVDGFTNAKVPDRNGEHVQNGREITPYVGTPSCRNPLFAASLPSAPGDELCNRPRGARPPEFITFTIIGGVPNQLLQGGPDWTKILGADPGAFNYTGLDSHMITSIAPRPALPPPSATRGDNGTDPIHGREWDTGGADLQYACTFALAATKTCAAGDPSCDCATALNPPLCAATVGQQIRGKAYPTLRELQVARGLGARAVVGSVCAEDASAGYRATMLALGDKLAPYIRR